MTHVLPNCKLTNTTATVLRSYDTSQLSDICTGIDVAAHTVYSLFAGVVIQVNKDDCKRCSVIVQYDSYRYVRYSHLKSASVKMGEIIKSDAEIGEADQFVHVEYMTTSVNTSDTVLFPVRVGAITLYKHDPTALVSGDFILDGGDSDA